MTVSDQPLAQEGYDLMGAAFEVHNVQGGGLSEEIYQQSLEIELTMRSIPFQSKHQLAVYYKQQPLETSISLICLSLNESWSNSKRLRL